MYRIIQAIIEWLQKLFGRGDDMSRWRDPSECADFEKVTIQFAGKDITVNKLYQSQFEQLNMWVMINNLDRYITRVDSFACRTYTATNPTWSFHSFGQAIDINPTDFPAQSGGRYNLPQWFEVFLDLARACGFRVGADWTTFFDPMHIEIGNRLR